MLITSLRAGEQRIYLW